jgi:DNA modification methylase
MTSKSVAAVAGALGDIADRDALVLDPFGARGTTLLAAEHTGQRARLIALDPGDVDATVLRYQALTGSDPIHEDTGATFAAIARARTERSAVAARETDND